MNVGGIAPNIHLLNIFFAFVIFYDSNTKLSGLFYIIFFCYEEMLFDITINHSVFL